MPHNYAGNYSFNCNDTPTNEFEEKLKTFLYVEKFNSLSIKDGEFTFYTESSEPMTKEEFKVGSKKYREIYKLEHLYDLQYFGKTFENDEFVVKYVDTDEVRNKVFDTVIAWFTDHEAFCGEVIQQSDNCIIDVPDLLSKIADDVIKFKVNYKE